MGRLHGERSEILAHAGSIDNIGPMPWKLRAGLTEIPCHIRGGLSYIHSFAPRKREVGAQRNVRVTAGMVDFLIDMASASC
jgi:hypothetical protein